MGLLRSHLGITIAACAFTDMVLIAIGVMGLAQLGALSSSITGALMGAAILFLLHYGWQAAQRALRPSKGGLGSFAVDAPRTSVRALGSALAFSWLNPHAWIDTAVIIGTASLAYPQPMNITFGVGAALGSTMWFVTLGLCASALSKHLSHPVVWRAIDVTVAVTMWGTAAWLAWGLFKA